MAGEINNPSAANPYTDAEAITAVRGNPETLSVLLKGGQFLYLPTGAGWTTSLVGTGTVTQSVARQRIYTGTTANSSALAYVDDLSGLSASVDIRIIDFGKKIYLIFDYSAQSFDAEIVSRVKLGEDGAVADLASKGIGIKNINYALWGNSYGTSGALVDLSVTMTTTLRYKIVIIHYPGSKVEWYVDNVLKATQSTAAKIPSGTTVTTAYLAHNIANAATGGLSGNASLVAPQIWQEA